MNNTAKGMNSGKVSFPYHSMCPLLYLWIQSKWWKSMQLSCKPHLLYYHSHRNTTGFYISFRNLTQKSAFAEMAMVQYNHSFGRRKTRWPITGGTSRIKMLYYLWPMHLLALTRISVPKCPLLRKNCKCNITQKQHFCLQRESSINNISFIR